MAEKKKKDPPRLSRNTIDPDQVAENPHLLPYSHERGGVEIRPIDKGQVKGRAMAAMYEQTDSQMDQIREQIELLARQARSLQDRLTISEEIYTAEMNFEPLIGKIYHLYRRSAGQAVLSLVGPAEWGSRAPYEFVATVRMLADHTWEVIARPDEDSAK